MAYEFRLFDHDIGANDLAEYLAENEIRIAVARVLEMVGYYSAEPDSQKFPFPLSWLGYPKIGNLSVPSREQSVDKVLTADNPRLSAVSPPLPFLDSNLFL